jgi:hypothetical protein
MGGVTVRDVDVSGYFSSFALPLYTSFMFGFVRGILHGRVERKRGIGTEERGDFA